MTSTAALDARPNVSGRKRRKRWLLPALLAVGLTIAVIILMMQASRPHWRTATLPIGNHTGLVLAFDYPDNFNIKLTAIKYPRSNSQVAGLISHPPTGLADWLNEHLLKQSPIEGPIVGLGIT